MDAQVRALMALARAQVVKADESEPFGTPPTELPDLTAPERYVLADLTVWFASTDSVRGQELPYRLVAELMDLGIPNRAAVEAGKLGMPPALTGRNRHGSPGPSKDMTASRRVGWQEPGMRARFVLASATRLAQAILDDRFEAQLADERRYRDMHVAMGRKRRQAARRVDDAAKRSRDGWLVWRCAAKPEAVCAALDGRLFKPDNPPGAYPGAVHPSCRCHAEPWMGVSPG